MQKIFTVRDGKGEKYFAPVLWGTHGEAERWFAGLANDEKGMISQFPEDYDLFHLGEFDERTGQYKILDSPQHIVKAVNLKKS